MDFIEGEDYSTLYVQQSDKYWVMILVYVDDILLFSTSQEEFNNVVGNFKANSRSVKCRR